MNLKHLKIFLLTTTTEGLIALIFLFIPPSMEKNAVLFGYSGFRITLGAVILLLISVLAVFTLLSMRDFRKISILVNKIDAYFQHSNHILIVITALTCMVISDLIMFAFFASPLAGHLGILVSIYHRSFSIILWFFLILLQTIVFIWLSYPSIRKQTGFINGTVIFKTCVFVFITLITIFHWLVLIFQLGIFGALPYWFWQWTHKKVTLWYALFPLIALLSFIGVRAVLKYPEKAIQNLFILIFLGYILQTGFGFMAGNGFESIRERFMRSGHNQYALHACDLPDLYPALTQYEEKYSQDMFLGTKPPGIIAFYITTQKVADMILPSVDFESCYDHLTMFTAVVFPLVSVLLLIILYHFSRSILGKQNAFLPCILYIFFPNVLLMHLELDQLFFPLLFLTGVYLIYLTVNRQSFILSIVTGAFIYLSVYFTFALLPILGLALAWYVIDAWMHRTERKLTSVIMLILGTALGILAICLLFYFTINYDILLRYTNAMNKHRMHKLYEPGFHQIINALMLNNIEFAIWSGTGIIILFILKAFKSLAALFKNKANQLDALVLSFSATYIALNFLGQTRGEVGRLWIFLLPVMVIFVSIEARDLLENKKAGFYYLIALQLVTTMLTYHFQDSIFM